MTYVIEQLGQNNFEKYFQRFGFDRALLPRCAGESKGGLRQRAPFSSGDFLRFGFGQGFTVTPLELATAYCAFANGGKLIRPRLVRKVVEYETGETTVFPPEVIQQVISPQVAKEVLGYLELVIEQGTGKNVALKGVRIAGKTGTAQKAIPGKGYVPGKKVTSFAAIVPVETPKYVILVVIDEPKTARSGAASAGPVVKEIIQQLLARENNQLRAAASVAGT